MSTKTRKVEDEELTPKEILRLYGMRPHSAKKLIAKIEADAIRSASDELGVDISDNDGDWWDGYRQGQRRQFAVLAEYADRIEKENTK